MALETARKRKERTYPELLEGGPVRLVVLACEIGGRWSTESLEFLRSLVRIRSRRAPRVLRRAAAQAWYRRWLSLLSVAAQKALAATLLEPRGMVSHGGAGHEVHLADVLQGVGALGGVSRLPLRG